MRLQLIQSVVQPQCDGLASYLNFSFLVSCNVAVIASVCKKYLCLHYVVAQLQLRNWSGGNRK